jgi:hypothetical protein
VRRLLYALAVLTACNNDTTFTKVPSSISVVPSLTDLGDVPVGITYDFDLQIAHTGGDAVTVYII